MSERDSEPRFAASKDDLTPRTDAEAKDGWSGDAAACSVEFAQKLERENNRMRATMTKLHALLCRTLDEYRGSLPDPERIDVSPDTRRRLLHIRDRVREADALLDGSAVETEAKRPWCEGCQGEHVPGDVSCGCPHGVAVETTADEAGVPFAVGETVIQQVFPHWPEVEAVITGVRRVPAHWLYNYVIPGQNIRHEGSPAEFLKRAVKATPLHVVKQEPLT